MKYLAFFCVTLCTACNNGSTTATTSDTTNTTTSTPVQADTAAFNAPACYRYQTNKDLISLKLNTIEPTVSGELTYALMEKDRNDGTITGTMRGDTLLADYKFMSEGTISVRQVVFLRKGNGFVEGYGQSKQEGDKMVFSNIGELSFGTDIILQKVPCSNP